MLARPMNISGQSALPQAEGLAQFSNQESQMGNVRRIRGLAILVLLVGCAAWLAALRIAPSPAGYGSHVQLGLPPCSMPMLTGYPCPTCGMTTSVAFAARGQFLASFRAQPAGLIFSLTVFAAIVGSFMTVCTGRRWELGRTIGPGVWVATIVGVVVLGWLTKIVMGLADGTLPLF